MQKPPSFIIKFLYALMIAPTHAPQSFTKELKSIFLPNQSSYQRLFAFINILDRIHPAISKLLSNQIIKANHFPFTSSNRISIIGSGAGAAVFKINDHVIRIYRKSFTNGVSSAMRTAKLYQNHFSTISAWYQGKHEIVLPMDFFIIQGPPVNQPAAASIQPFLPSSRKDFFRDFSQDQLIGEAQKHPKFKESLLFFLKQTFIALNDQNACPDIVGEDNIIILIQNNFPKIHILDTGVLYLNDIQKKSPARIPQIKTKIQYLESLYQSLSDMPKSGDRNYFSPPSESSSTDFFFQHIKTNANKYYPELNPHNIQLELTQKINRVVSRLFYFDISDQLHTHSIIIKVAHPKPQSSETTNHHRKPRLYPATNPSEMYILELQALKTIQAHFENTNPEIINTIKVLDELPAKHAFAMETVKLPNLRKKYLSESTHLSGKLKQPTAKAFQHAGIWLHQFHSIPIKDHVQNRHTTKDDFIENIKILTDYLKKISRHQNFLKNISASLISFANQHFPEELPLGLGHGDFAARNILANESGVVTIIDTFAKWNAPIYEDIGYLLNDLHTSKYHFASKGLIFSNHRINVYERAFLSGYFNDKVIPYPQIKLFEALALLDKWADTADKIHHTVSYPKSIKSILLKLTDSHAKARIRQILKDIPSHE